LTSGGNNFNYFPQNRNFSVAFLPYAKKFRVQRGGGGAWPNGKYATGSRRLSFTSHAGTGSRQQYFDDSLHFLPSDFSKSRWIKPIVGLHVQFSTVYRSICTLTNCYKKAVLSQRWPRDATYIWPVHWKFSLFPDYAHGYFSPKFFMGFCS